LFFFDTISVDPNRFEGSGLLPSTGHVTGQSQESQWVLRAQCGDREALELLLQGVQPALHRYIRGIAGPTLADDVLQETFILVARKLRWLEEPDVFRAWAFRIASRVAFRLLRKERRWQGDDAQLDDLPAPDVRPSEDLLRKLIDTDVLSPASRAVLVLHFDEELSLPDVAAILEVPLGTVKSRLAYGLAAIRKHLGKNRSV
jgi:RNA polymerase sigma-70 factor (ECF subfamily)